MTPTRIQRLSEELEALLKSLRSSDTASTPTTILNDGSMDNRQYRWILVTAVLAVVVVVAIILAVTITVTRRFSRSRLDRARKRYFAAANRR